MRNLKLLDSLRVADATELENTQSMCVDYDTKVIYCATATGLYGLDPKIQEVVCHVSLLEAGYLPQDGSGMIVGIEHLPDQMSVCVATASGDVILWNTTNNQLECVGSVDHGLTAMSWSTDQELVVLATCQQTLIMMTREFDPVTEVSMFLQEFGEAAFVNVGWGKKETQFHGSEGKHAALAKKSECVDPACAWDDKKTRICWHGDGQFFAVSAIQPDTGSRRVHVWTRECTLHSTGEIVDKLEQGLGWKSTGNLITSSQHRPNRHDIVFFERNGLRHGEFTLPFGVDQVKVLELHWNRESTILAIWLEDLPPNNSPTFAPHSYVQLWTVGNYHWYLKQTLEFPTASSDRVSAMCWDQEYANRLHIICQGGQYLQYSWAWVTDCSTGLNEQNRANVAVIDGDKVLMTSLRQMVVPPPMSAYQLQLQSPVNQVIFAPVSAPTDFAVFTNDKKIVFFTFEKEMKPTEQSLIKIGAAGGNGFSVKCDIPVLRGIYSLADDSSDSTYPLKYYHITWYKPNAMLLCALNIMGSETDIYTATIHHDSTNITLSSTCAVGGYIYNTAVSPDSGTIVMELTDGRLLQYHPESHTVSPWQTASGEQVTYSAPRLCTSIDVCTMGEQEVVLGLTDHYQFYVNNTEVASNCTSYGIHDEFLLLTTYAHTCRCIARKTKVNALSSLSDGKAHPFDESIRRVERGSRIVAVAPVDTKVVLQMPRGNLETIHPRALVLCAVRKHLDRYEFQEAFVLMRKHRINLNLMHDHNPQGFLDNVDKFIDQVDSPTLINQFLTDLQEEDVTQRMYTASYDQQATNTASTVETNTSSKIDKICDTIRQSLERTNPEKYLLSILTTYVRKSKPELDIALKTVKDIKGSSGKDSISAEEALKYLLFLVDVDELYDVALGTYDFQLVLMVAEKSQKDPKEYIPFLNSLRKMEKNYQQYSIDKHLKRYTSALKHIVKCEDRFEECMALIKEHRLYREALSLYTHSTQQYKNIAKAYGLFLREKNHPEEAGLIFSKAEAWGSAIEAYEQSLNWRLSLCMAYRAGYKQNQLDELCLRLVKGLRESNRHNSAACILEHHLNDLEEAIVTLIEGCQWEDALILMHKSSRTDFIETHFDSALLENHSQFMTLLSSVYPEFEKHKNRLALVRQQKEKARLEFLEGGCDHNAADADLFSDTSSATGESAISGLSATDSNRSTIFSKRSGRSAKTRRKQERKKWSLKEGSVYEDIALIETLSKTCKQTEDWRGEVSQLLKMLSLFHHDAESSELQQQFDELLKLVEKSVPEIWPEEADESETMTPSIGPDSTANTIALAMQQGGRIRPQIKIESSLRVAPTLSKDNKWKLHSSDR